MQLFASVALVLCAAANGVLFEEQPFVSGVGKTVSDEFAALDSASKNDAVPEASHVSHEEELPEIYENDNEGNDDDNGGNDDDNEENDDDEDGDDDGGLMTEDLEDEDQMEDFGRNPGNHRSYTRGTRRGYKASRRSNNRYPRRSNARAYRHGNRQGYEAGRNSKDYRRHGDGLIEDGMITSNADYGEDHRSKSIASLDYDDLDGQDQEMEDADYYRYRDRRGRDSRRYNRGRGRRSYGQGGCRGYRGICGGYFPSGRRSYGPGGCRGYRGICGGYRGLHGRDTSYDGEKEEDESMIVAAE